VLVLVALMCLAFLLAFGVLLALAWALRALWARLTGKPVHPWHGSMRTSWQTVYRSGAQWMAQKTTTAHHPPQRPRRASALSGAGDITDVQPREVREH